MGDELKESKESDHINLRVSSQDGSEVFFKIRKNTPMRKLMDAYCARQSIALNSVDFYMMGKESIPNKLPKIWTWKTMI